MSLTEKQKHCPYCRSHIYEGNSLDEASNSGCWVDMDMSGTVEYGVGDITGKMTQKFNYCPMCGRPLNKEDNDEG